MILECYAVWISNNNFGLFFRPIAISFMDKQVYNYNFFNDSESESEEEIPDTEANIFMKVFMNFGIWFKAKNFPSWICFGKNNRIQTNICPDVPEDRICFK